MSTGTATTEAPERPRLLFFHRSLQEVDIFERMQEELFHRHWHDEDDGYSEEDRMLLALYGEDEDRRTGTYWVRTEASDSGNNHAHEVATTATTTRHIATNIPTEEPYIFVRSPFECPICCDAVRRAAVPVCGHVFCFHCIDNCRRRPFPFAMDVCPVCRGSLTCLIRVFDIDKVMEAYFASLVTGEGDRSALDEFELSTTRSNSATPDSNPISMNTAQAEGYRVFEGIRNEWAHLRLTLGSNVGRRIFRKLFCLRIWKLPLTFGTGLILGLALSQLIFKRDSTEYAIKMSTWQHFVATIRSFQLGLVDLVPQVIAPTPTTTTYEKVINWIQRGPFFAYRY